MPESSTWLASALAWVLASSLKGTILIGLVLVVRRFLTPATASRMRYALWLPVLLGLLCPVGPSVQLWSRSADAAVESATQPDGRATRDQMRNATSPGTRAIRSSTGTRSSQPRTEALAGTVAPVFQPARGAQAPQFDSARPGYASALALRWVALIWAGVALILGLLYLRNLARYSRIVRRGHPAAPVAAAALRSCEAELRLQRNVRILESDDIDSPSVFGFWHPALLLPTGLCRRLDAGSLRLVILHELAHVKANDVLVNWICALTQMLHWFNPVVWFAMRCARRDMEHACDARVLTQLSAAEREDYGHTLVHLADPGAREPSLAYGLGIADRHSDLKERLTMIAHLGPASNGTRLTACVALLGFTSLALTQPLLAQHPDPGTTRPAMLRVAEANDAVNSPAASGSGRADGIPLDTLAAQVAANIHRRLIVEPSARHLNVLLYGQKLEQITYSDLLTILRVNGLTAIDVNDYINVVQVDRVRWLPLPTLSDGKELPADQFADMSIVVKNACAPALIPILRPWMANYAYLAADQRSNSILAIDTYANLKRIRGVIGELDARTKPGLRCGPPDAVGRKE